MTKSAILASMKGRRKSKKRPTRKRRANPNVEKLKARLIDWAHELVAKAKTEPPGMVGGPERVN